MPLAITDQTTEFVTLAEVKRHLNIPYTDTDDDDELDMIRSAAQEHVEALIGPVLHRDVTQTVASSSGLVVLNTLPVLSVASVVAGGVTLTGHTLDGATGLLSGVYSYVPTMVTYKAGRDSCPDAVRLATLIVASHFWRTQLGNSPSALPDSDAVPFDPSLSSGSEIPPRAQALLEPYRLLPGVA